MDARIGCCEQDKDGNSLQSQPESPAQFGSFGEILKATSNTNCSHRKSSTAAQKRVVSIPIRDSKGMHFNGEGAIPPSDSWAWRKYGQKPIKGSPYPRGYYRCSSSKGCPARKQVERSQDDPTMLVVTYSCEHNHPWPATRNNHRGYNNHKEKKPENSNGHSSPDPDPDEKGAADFLPEESGSRSPWLDVADEFGWFMDVRMTPTPTLKSPIFGEDYYHRHHRSDNKNVTKISIGEADVAMFLPMREEDESLFSDLGELPEYAIVFRDGNNNNNSNNGVI